MTVLRRLAVAVLLAGPAVIAFFTGGYLDAPRLWGGLVAWALVVAGLVAGGDVPRTREARLALGGLAGLAAWTLLSTAWAPVAGAAWDAGQVAVLYLGVVVAATVLLRAEPRAQPWVEPALAAGTVVVIGYALSERLLPGILEFARSASARGRLEQPLTYWNALGAVAALGVVLCARLAGTATRPLWVRSASAAAAAPLGLGLYLTVSRGALFACAAGLLTLALAAARREQLRAIAVAAGAAVLAAIAGAPFGGVAKYTGGLGARERDGLIVLVLLLVVMILAALVQRVIAVEEQPGPVLLPRAAPWVALGVVVAGFVLAIALGGDERTAGALSPGATRYATFTSNRYDYWKVGARAFAAEPVHGVGAAGWAVWWRRERPFREGAHDAHSLYVQTAAELGLVGLALLAAWLAGVGLAAREGLEHDSPAVAGAIAGIAVWAAHVALDWDFEMPAATLPALILMGALLARLRGPRRSAAPRG